MGLVVVGPLLCEVGGSPVKLISVHRFKRVEYIVPGGHSPVEGRLVVEPEPGGKPVKLMSVHKFNRVE